MSIVYCTYMVMKLFIRKRRDITIVKAIECENASGCVYTTYDYGRFNKQTKSLCQLTE